MKEVKVVDHAESAGAPVAGADKAKHTVQLLLVATSLESGG